MSLPSSKQPRIASLWKLQDDLQAHEWVESQPVAYAAFGSGKPSKGEMRNMYHVNGRSKRGIESLLATKIPVICAPMYRPEIPKKLLRPLGNFEYAAVDDHTKEITIDVLIGLDNYWKFVKPGVKALKGISAEFQVIRGFSQKIPADLLSYDKIHS